jgi:hypothetical protein
VECAQEELAKSGCAYTIHTLYDTLKPSVPPEHATRKDLHISLSHPLPLRSHQIPDFLEHLKVQLSGSKHPDVKPFRLGLDCRVVKYRNGIARAAATDRTRDSQEGDDGLHETLEDYEDDDPTNSAADQGRAVGDATGNLLADLGKSGVGKGGRAFLALRVRAGHSEVGFVKDSSPLTSADEPDSDNQLERIQSEIIDPFLRLHHLPTYHSNPEFHTSFAWVLVPVPTPIEPSTSTTVVDDPFTEEVLQHLRKRFEKAILDAQPKGGWQVDKISTKIGKTYRDFALSYNAI